MLILILLQQNNTYILYLSPASRHKSGSKIAY